MDPIRKLEELFSNFPGIGPRQAKRFVYHVISRSPAYAKELISLIEDVRKSSASCSGCRRFFQKKSDLKDGDLCQTCKSNDRDKTVLMVLARDTDYEVIERSGAYKGLYFILGGTVPILDKEPEKKIRLQSLLEKVVNSQFKEIILSLSATPDGDHTADIVREALENLLGKSNETAITVLGRGISKGAELEYMDGDTLKNALINRKQKTP